MSLTDQARHAMLARALSERLLVALILSSFLAASPFSVLDVALSRPPLYPTLRRWPRLFPW
eukprot:3741992-Pleurochrysis_carterae.AAC.1